MRLMLLQVRADDYLIATGECHSLEEFFAAAFGHAGLDWRDQVVIDDSLSRPLDLEISRGNLAKAQRILGWKARYRMRRVAEMMMEAALDSEASANERSASLPSG